MSTDYIPPRVEIDGIHFNKATISEESYLMLAADCIFNNKSCHSYFRVKGK